MQDHHRSQLNLRFPETAREWRVVELSNDKQQARVRPQLKYLELNKRLNDVFGIDAWSYKFVPVADQAIICELSLDGVSKSAIVSFKQSWQDAVSAAYDAFVYAAEAFGLSTGLDLSLQYWVDYDLENQAILFEPELESSETESPKLDARPLITEESTTLDENKPQGQQAIDRLLDRLKQEGLGLQAAKLLINYNGYGENPEEARELYSQLRALLVGAS